MDPRRWQDWKTTEDQARYTERWFGDDACLNTLCAGRGVDACGYTDTEHWGHSPDPMRKTMGACGLEWHEDYCQRSCQMEAYWFASASFSGPLLSHSVEFCGFVCLFVCVFVCPQLWGQISRKPKELEQKLLWGANRKLVGGYRLVTSPMTSRDPMTSYAWRHTFQSKCFFSHSSCQN